MIRLFDKNKEIKKDTNEYIFSIFPLDNFSAFGLTMDNKYFKTGEHAFQYLKFIDTNKEVANMILESKSPNEARELAHKYKKERVSNWSDIKYEIMEKVFRLKYEQNKEVQEALKLTKNYTIMEYCIDEDTDWGVDHNLQGDNNLGKIWMKIRNNK